MIAFAIGFIAACVLYTFFPAPCCCAIQLAARSP